MMFIHIEKIRNGIMVISILLAGCATSQTELAEDIAESRQVQMQMEKEQKEYNQENAEKTLEQVPEWALSSPT